MAKRTQYYQDMDDKAEDALKSAENTRQQIDGRLQALDEEIREERTKARDELDAQRERQIADAKADAEKIIADARSKAEREKEDIIASAQKDITAMVTDAIDKLALDKTAPEAFDAFLDSAESKEA